MHNRITELFPILKDNAEHSVSNSLFGGILIYISTLSKSEQLRFVKDVEKSISSFRDLVKTENITEIQIISKEMNYVVGKRFSPDTIAESASSMYASFDKLIASNNSNSESKSESNCETDVIPPSQEEGSPHSPSLEVGDNEEISNPPTPENNPSPGEKTIEEEDSEDNIVAFGFVEENAEEPLAEEIINTEEPMGDAAEDNDVTTEHTDEPEPNEEEYDVFNGLFNELEEPVLDEYEEDINAVLGEES